MEYAFRTEAHDDPFAWRAADLHGRDDWIVRPDDSDRRELDDALASAKGSGRNLFEFTLADFPLSTLADKLAAIPPVLEGGRGFVLLRGIPVDRYTENETRIVFWGIGQHIGTLEPQDRAGNLMHDVRDTGKTFAESNTLRDYQTDAAINFHNDGADIFMLMCRRAAPRGGRSLLVSAVEVFNEALRRRPDLARLLQEPCWYMDTRGQRRDGARYQVMPIYTYWNGQLTPNYKNSLMYAAQRFDDVPPFSQAQKEAIALLDEVCSDPEICLEFDLEPGDIAIASNFNTFHGRTNYSDAAASDSKRHMLRMWLTIPNGRPLPPNFEGTREYGATYARRMTSGGAG